MGRIKMWTYLLQKAGAWTHTLNLLYHKKAIIQRNNKFHTTTVLHRYNHIVATVRRRIGPLNSLTHNHTCNASTKIWTSFTHKIQNSNYLWHRKCINPLNPKLNPICYLLALLWAHHFLDVSRIRDKLLTFKLLM